EPVRVLVDRRVVEVELLAERGQRFRRRGAAEDGARRVARQRLRGGEHDERHEEQRDEAERDSSEYEAWNAAVDLAHPAPDAMPSPDRRLGRTALSRTRS